MTFSECLEAAFSTQQGVWIDLGDEIHIRLERFVQDGQFIKGEFTRKQTVNLPPKVRGNGTLQPSPEPIAHRVAFQYHPRLSILAIEANKNSISLTKVNNYIQQILQHHGFDFLPVQSRAAWEKLNDCNPRSLTIRVAHPENMSAVEGASRTLTQNLVAMREVLGGPVVELQVGFGRQRDGLLDRRNLMTIIRGLMRQHEQHGNVEKLQIKADGEQEPLDLLLEQIKEKETLELDDNNIDAHYQMRRDFIESVFRAHMPTIRDIYGQAA